jgi:hypothetical protein
MTVKKPERPATPIELAPVQPQIIKETSELETRVTGIFKAPAPPTAEEIEKNHKIVRENVTKKPAIAKTAFLFLLQHENAAAIAELVKSIPANRQGDFFIMVQRQIFENCDRNAYQQFLASLTNFKDITDILQEQIKQAQFEDDFEMLGQVLACVKDYDKTFLVGELNDPNKDHNQIKNGMISFVKAWLEDPQADVKDLEFLNRIKDTNTIKDIFKKAFFKIWPPSIQCATNLRDLFQALYTNPQMQQVTQAAMQEIVFERFLNDIDKLMGVNQIDEKTLTGIVNNRLQTNFTEEQLKRMKKKVDATNIQSLRYFFDQYIPGSDPRPAYERALLLNKIETTPPEQLTFELVKKWLDNNSFSTGHVQFLLQKIQKSNLSDFRFLEVQYRSQCPFGKENIGILQAVVKQLVEINVWIQNVQKRPLSLDDVLQFSTMPASWNQIDLFLQVLRASRDPVLGQIYQQYIGELQKDPNPYLALLRACAPHASMKAVLTTQDLSFRDVMNCLSFPWDERGTQVVWERMKASDNVLIQKAVSYINVPQPNQQQLLASLNFVKSCRFSDEIEALRHITRKVQLTDIERILRLEKLYNYTLRNIEVAQLSSLIPKQDSPISSLSGKNTRDDFIAAFLEAREQHNKHINARLQNEEPLTALETTLLVAMGPNEDQVKKILEKTLMPNLEKRFLQIQTATSREFESRTMSPRRILEIALYIEQEKDKADIKNNIFRMCQTGLARTFQTSGEHVFILAKKHLSVLKGEGTFKKVTAAAGIPLNDYVKTIKAARVFTKINLSRQEIINTQNEMTMTERLGKKPGFLKFYTWRPYYFGFRNLPPFLRVSAVMERVENNLAQKIATFSDKQRVQYSENIIAKIASQHAEGLYFGDFKLENCVEQETASGLEATPIDFGSTCELQKKQGEPGKFDPPDNELYQIGLYVTPGGSPPWFFGLIQYKGDPLKVESYVVARELWRLFYNEYAPLALEMAQVYPLHKNKVQQLRTRTIELGTFEDWQRMLAQKRTQWTAAIQTAIENKKNTDPDLQNLTDKTLNNPMLTSIQRMKLIMLEMMNPDVNKQMTVMDAQKLLQQMKESAHS